MRAFKCPHNTSSWLLLLTSNLCLISLNMPPPLRKKQDINPFLSRRYTGNTGAYHSTSMGKKRTKSLDYGRSMTMPLSYSEKPFGIHPSSPYEPQFSEVKGIHQRMCTPCNDNYGDDDQNGVYFSSPVAYASIHGAACAPVQAGLVGPCNARPHVFSYGFGMIFTLLVILTLADWIFEYIRSDFVKKSKISI